MSKIKGPVLFTGLSYSFYHLPGKSLVSKYDLQPD